MIVLGGVLLVVPQFALAADRAAVGVARFAHPLTAADRLGIGGGGSGGTAYDELEAGSALRPAFERAVQATGDPAFARAAVAVCRMGGDVPRPCAKKAPSIATGVAGRAGGRSPEGSGAALASALDRLVGAAEQSAKLRREVAAQLAGPRARSAFWQCYRQSVWAWAC